MAIETNPRQSSIEYAVIEPPIAEIMSKNYLSLSHHTQALLCPSCHSLIMTDTEYVTTSKTHLVACMLAPILCCFLPYYLKCKNVNHKCPQCYAFIGTYEF